MWNDKIRLKTIVQLFVAVSLHLTSHCGAEDAYCYAQDNHPYLNFNSKTVYETVRNKDGIPPQQGCHAVQIWMLCRHGTRWFIRSEYPEFVNLTVLRDQVVSNYDANQTKLCAQDISNLKNVLFNVSISNAGLLTEQGRQDMSALGQRLASYFPHLLNGSYSPDKYILLHDEVLRTNESAVYFAKGLFGMDFNTSLPDTNSSTISVINPFGTCRQWLDSFQQAKRQKASLDESERMSLLIARVSRRLGFTSNLTLNNVYAIYEGCIYYNAWSPGKKSAWCTAFTKLDLEAELGVRLVLKEHTPHHMGVRLCNKLREEI